MASVLDNFKCFALRTKHEGKYLQSVHRQKAGGSRIEASADAVAGNARTRFFVEPAEEEDGLVHVRCCYNNKYWVPVKDSGSSRWVIGTADEPKEDLSSDSCTLFAPIATTDQSVSIRFRHPKLHKYAGALSIDDKPKPLLQLADDQENTSNVFTVLGLSQQKELPKYVAFKQGDGNYLGLKLAREILQEVASTKKFAPKNPDFGPSEDELLVFHTQDIGHEGVICIVFTNDDGTIRIKSKKEEGFWRRYETGYIAPHDGETSYTEADTLFKVISGDEFIALRNLGNNQFCKIVRHSMGYEYLSACDGSISHYTRLKFEEPVVKKKISDVNFRLKEARVYNTQIVKLQGICRTNDTGSPMETTFSFNKKTEVVTKWQTSVSSMTGFESSFGISNNSEAPIIINGEVKLSRSSTLSDGKETTESTTEETKEEEKRTIPPRTTIAGQLIATRSCSDVPYSYKQRIVLTTGEEIASNHDDGIYTIANNYGFHIFVTDKKDEIKRIMGESF